MHLIAENTAGTGTGAVGLGRAVVQHVTKKLEVGLHGPRITHRGPFIPGGNRRVVPGDRACTQPSSTSPLAFTSTGTSRRLAPRQGPPTHRPVSVWKLAPCTAQTRMPSFTRNLPGAQSMRRPACGHTLK